MLQVKKTAPATTGQMQQNNHQATRFNISLTDILVLENAHQLFQLFENIPRIRTRMLSRRASDSRAAIGASSGHLDTPLEWQEGKNAPAQLPCGHAYNLADEGPVNRLWDFLKAATIGESQTGGSPNTRHVSMFRGNMSVFGVCGKPGSPRRAVAAPLSLVITISTSNIDTYLRSPHRLGPEEPLLDGPGAMGEVLGVYSKLSPLEVGSTGTWHRYIAGGR
ncbi:hypothetical protein B0H67DRAFT_150435 [Lasiosphaeris hirsuta]|uniref:Uncharacterized protein n=1 Tax=Lasiosphaeris hirsuta TaxID=260670 RepID=A0AA40DWV6_9PEZI|nr:hypothetical protein B0H67DRAFT_150435 [Lasiosphaeris hirsuta]